MDGLGKDINEAVDIMSVAGLSEASLMIRRFDELSDGQKYRYRFAKVLRHDDDAYVIDELAPIWIG